MGDVRPMNPRVLLAGAALAAAGVALGAFGAHALRGTLSAQQLGWWETGVQYQMWHAIGLVALGSAPAKRIVVPAILLVAGTLLFSGSLYLMALTDTRWLGAITPFGGVALIAGWLCFGWSALRARRSAGDRLDEQ